MSELGCSRHQLELALKKTLELYASIKRVSIFGDEHGGYGYPHYCNQKVLSQEDLQAAVKAKKQYLMKVKSSDERKGQSLLTRMPRQRASLVDVLAWIFPKSWQNHHLEESA